ncbi:hypothetical protein BJV74DRAFT_102136 [Russula compacta]|nr:hypothetical protein BJV74DRAFT_102136 [Russula compacta]
MIPMIVTSLGPTTQHAVAPFPQEHSLQSMSYRHTTIEMLPEDILLEIFDFYRLDAVTRSGGRPWKWHRLAHVCQKWRSVIFMSPRRLGLRILCKSKAPMEHIMDFWPTLPLVVRYKNPKPSSLNKNIVAALRRPNRVCEIDLNVTSVTIGPIVELIQEPFLSLERLKMQIMRNSALAPPVFTRFLGGSSPRLEEIELDAFTSGTSRILVTFYRMPSSLACPPWSTSRLFEYASVSQFLSRPQPGDIYLQSAPLSPPSPFSVFVVRANIWKELWQEPTSRLSPTFG